MPKEPTGNNSKRSCSRHEPTEVKGVEPLFLCKKLEKKMKKYIKMSKCIDILKSIWYYNIVRKNKFREGF